MRLSARVLGRATLRRQMWLRRADRTVTAAVRELERGEVVRSTMMRATQHMLTAEDFALVRPALAPLLRRVQRNAFGSRTAGVDLDELVAQARELLGDGRVLTRPELGRLLARTRPGSDATALGWSVQYLLPVVHPAPSGTWNTRGATPFALAPVPVETTAAGVAELVRRYLAAFGPASVSDARAWSGIGGLREIFDRLRPELVVHTGDSGRELFDLPGAPLPDADEPAPVRFLPEFDAPLLAYADRTRLMTDDVRRTVCVGAAVAATVLVDGTVAATWSVADGRVRVRVLRALSRAEEEAVEAEAARLSGFLRLGGC